MPTHEDFKKLVNEPIIGDAVKELYDLWQKLGCPESDYSGPTTETYINDNYWTDYEQEDENWSSHYNSLLDDLYSLVDVRNIANNNNPIWYVNYYRDEKFEEYEEEGLTIIKENADYIYQKVCELSEDEMIKLGYEFNEEDEENEE